MRDPQTSCLTALYIEEVDVNGRLSIKVLHKNQRHFASYFLEYYTTTVEKYKQYSANYPKIVLHNDRKHERICLKSKTLRSMYEYNDKSLRIWRIYIYKVCVQTVYMLSRMPSIYPLTTFASLTQIQRHIKI